ncbi:MAG: DHHA1 domain-containing protein [Candidatus Pacearchaeota archaeon]|jgi:single-stranded DNA-specific DHH superfamily exonuclease
MLSDKQVEEIREHLEKAQNPLFFFDNDNDGLISFLLLRRFIDRGKGVVIRSFPELNISYYRKITELNPDYVFILDKPIVSKEFLEKIHADSIPIVWIDHHQVDKCELPFVNYYNPFHNDGTNEPVSYLCYKIVNRKEDSWLALVGNISDCFMPDFYKDVEKLYPELLKKNPDSPFDLLYNSEIGKIARILDFSLKDSITNVVNMTKFMMKVRGPMDILEENPKTKQILKHYNEVDLKYQKLMNKAREDVENKVIYFQYGGVLSLSSHIANQLSFEYQDKVIVVVYISGDVANISIRGQGDIRKLTIEAISEIDGATGGGHKNATGAKMSVSYLPKFKERFEELVDKEG